ncbi:amidohydrolase family protein [Nocardioides antri]|uniref:Amidohydrolase n=1 Tax=Nocardioides antri TaxID=2607659 RepID=A0A5B1LUC7_9ACTN|nr:amidohydrolase family protein [Nocardioides antri]KAA1424282.1 amidohydrolase [Nocardioides antri]
MTDAEAGWVRAFWQDLGLPGLIDLHVHFLPPPIERAVWREFDTGGAKIGRPWPIRYRQSQEERAALLRDFGVRCYPTLPYAHKPGVASYLNEWSRAFAADVPEALWTATFYPEPEAPAYVEDLVADGVRVFKIHLQVGEFHLDDPLLDPVWKTLESAGTPVVVHAGSGPVGNEFTGPASTARLLARFPRLVLVVAHMGTPEAEAFLELAEQYDGVHLDTSMAFTDFFAERHVYPRELLPRLAALQGRVVYGSDFPTLPFAYVDQLGWLAGLGLGDDWLRAVCWGNAARLLGIP